MQEVWKDVVGYESYFMVSNFGNIFSKRSKRNLKQFVSKTGYKIFSTKLSGRNSKAICFKVHRLVAEAFLEEPSKDMVDRAEQEFYGKVIVRHKDNNKLNNHVDNLAWGNSRDNTADWMQTDNYIQFRESQAGHRNVQSKLTEEEVRYIRSVYKPYDPEFGSRALAEVFGLHHTKISRVARGVAYKTVV